MKKAVLTVAVALGLSALEATAQSVDFMPAQNYQVSEPFRNLVVKDTNNDGIPDLIGHGNTNSTSSRSFSILTNKGTGSFNQEQLYATPEGDEVQDVGDFDGDGYQDVLCATYWGNGVALYFGNQHGGYENRLFAPTAVHGHVAAFADLNHDGLQDLLQITTGSGQPNILHIFYGNRHRSLQQKATFDTNTASARFILPVDLNNDGRLDIAAPTTGTHLLAFIQQPDGSFTHHTVDLYSPLFERGIDFWDYNKDGFPDLVTAHFEGDSITLRLNNGHGHFMTKAELTLHVPHPVQPTIADIDNDNLADIVFASSADGVWANDLFLVRNNGNGSFSNPIPVATTEQMALYRLADVNEDGYKDVVLSQANYPKVHVLLNNSAGPTHAPEPVEKSFIKLTYTPFNNLLLTPTKHLDELQLQVMDVNGKLLCATKFDKVALGVPIELPMPFASGIYIIRACTPTAQSAIRLFLP